MLFNYGNVIMLDQKDICRFILKGSINYLTYAQ